LILPAAAESAAAGEAAAAPVVIVAILLLLLRALIELRRVDDARDDLLARLEARDDFGIHAAREPDHDFALRRGLRGFVPDLYHRAARLHRVSRSRAGGAATAAVEPRDLARAALAAAAESAAALTTAAGESTAAALTTTAGEIAAAAAAAAAGESALREAARRAALDAALRGRAQRL